MLTFDASRRERRWIADIGRLCVLRAIIRYLGRVLTAVAASRKPENERHGCWPSARHQSHYPPGYRFSSKAVVANGRARL